MYDRTIPRVTYCPQCGWADYYDLDWEKLEKSTIYAPYLDIRCKCCHQEIPMVMGDSGYVYEFFYDG